MKVAFKTAELNKNWAEIQKLPDKFFRVAVCLATNEEVLKGLKTGFPNLFCEQPVQPQGIPLLALRLYMGDSFKEGCNQAMDFFGIEYVSFLEKMNEESSSELIPREVHEQLSHQRFTDYKIGHELTWNGENYILVGIKIGCDHNFLHLDSVTIAKASYFDTTV